MVVVPKKFGMADGLFIPSLRSPRPRRIAKKRYKRHDRITLRNAGVRFKANSTWKKLRELVIKKVVAPVWSRVLDREISMKSPLYECFDSFLKEGECSKTMNP